MCLDPRGRAEGQRTALVNGGRGKGFSGPPEVR